jgi:hypothetical protein
MKIIFALLALAVMGMSVSCRVNPPLDPATMRPSCKCCPQNFYHGYASSCNKCGGSLIVSSK